MSSYSDTIIEMEDTVVDEILFVIFCLVMMVMLVLSLVTIYRSHYANVKEKARKLNKVRYLTMICIILQWLTFIGYYLELHILYRITWNLWIPCFTISLALLSYNITTIYLDTIHMSTRRQYNKRIKSNNSKLRVISSQTINLPPIRRKYSQSHSVTTTASMHTNSIDVDDINIDSSVSVSESDIDDDISIELSFDLDIDEDFLNASTPGAINCKTDANGLPVEYTSLKKARSARDIVTSSLVISATSISRLKKRLKPLFWRKIWFLWIICSISNWCGCICGYFFNLYITELCLYIFWKLICCLMLLLCIYILFTVKLRLQHVLNKNNKPQQQIVNKNSKMNRNLIRGNRRVHNLIISECILCIFLLISCLYEIYIIIILINNEFKLDQYNINNLYNESILLSMIIYFPFWTSIHCVLLVYNWIHKYDLQKQKPKQTKKQTTKPTCTNNNNKVLTESEQLPIINENVTTNS